MLRLVGRKLTLMFQPMPADGNKLGKPLIDLAQQELDWQPKIALADDLKETIAYFKRTLDV